MENDPVSVPTIIRDRMSSAGYSSMRELERTLNMSNGRLRKYLREPKPSLVTMLTLLKALDYDCNSPEFTLIKQICGFEDLQAVDSESTIATVKKPRAQKKQNLQVLCAKSSRLKSVA